MLHPVLRFVFVLSFALAAPLATAANAPFRASSGMVVSQNDIASRIGVEVLEEGGSAVDAAVAG